MGGQPTAGSSKPCAKGLSGTRNSKWGGTWLLEEVRGLLGPSSVEVSEGYARGARSNAAREREREAVERGPDNAALGQSDAACQLGEPKRDTGHDQKSEQHFFVGRTLEGSEQALPRRRRDHGLRSRPGASQQQREERCSMPNDLLTGRPRAVRRSPRRSRGSSASWVLRPKSFPTHVEPLGALISREGGRARALHRTWRDLTDSGAGRPLPSW